MGKFHGDIEKLKSIVKDYGLKGAWTETANAYKFTTNDGGILNWYENTGTLQCQGRGVSKAKIEGLIKDLGDTTEVITVEEQHPTNVLANPNLFIVYGHDETSRDQLELILSKLNIESFILAKSSGHGLTIIEALEKQVGKDGSANVGIVLLTPDDMGFAKRDGEGSLKDRARQNVILEMGMLISKLGRSNTIILVKGNLERPSDTDGIIYLSYTSHIKEIALALVERLESAGCNIDHKKALDAAR